MYLFLAASCLHSVHFLVHSVRKTSQNITIYVKMTHRGGCKNWFQGLELWNEMGLKSEAALLTELRDISPIGKQVIHWNWFTLSANSWRQKSHNSEMIRHVVFTWGLFTPLETLKPLNWLISEPNFLAAFLRTKDNFLPHRGQPQLICPQSSFTGMDNSIGSYVDAWFLQELD